MTAGYRPEIDGLRAVAVLAVIFNHAQVPGFMGGFVGVDVFFVISGYLITQIILRDCAAGRFCLAKFYERRIRRILPALFGVLTATTVAALILLPPHLQRYGQSMVAVDFFLSNGFFWHESANYFGPAAATMPLLHTWSLAVEEQFYLVFPVIILAAQRFGYTLNSIVLCGLVSFLCAVGLNHSAFEFYSPFTRAWELMIGACLAAGIAPVPTSRGIAGSLATGGFFLLVLSIVKPGTDISYSSYAPLLPCIGTALILQGAAKENSVVTRILIFKPLVALGLISYSLYLWHWPLLIFGTYYVLDPRHLPFARAVSLLLCLPVSAASWRYIERPFRANPAIISRRLLFSAVVGFGAVTAVAGCIFFGTRGLPGRFGGDIQRILAEPDVALSPCHNQPVSSIRGRHYCPIGVVKDRPDFIIWGDSHADMYHDALDELARRYNSGGIMFSASGCPPLVGFLTTGPCLERNAAVLEKITELKPRAVIMAGRWDAYVSAARQIATLQAAVSQTINRLSQDGRAVYFVSDIPDARGDVRSQMAKAAILGIDQSHGPPDYLQIAPTGADYLRTRDEANFLADNMEQKGESLILNPASSICGADGCRVSDGEIPLYRNARHLSRSGAERVSPAFEPLIRSLGH